jgi:hypothetical protein
VGKRTAVTLTVIGVLVMACAREPSASHLSGATPEVPVVPWVASPPPAPLTATPSTPPDLSGPLCEAGKTDTEFAGGNGGGGHALHEWRVTNRSTVECVLNGYPKVQARTGDRTIATAERGGYFPDSGRPGRLAPGESGVVWLETVYNCPARTAVPPPEATLRADTLVFGFGGSERAVSYQIDVLCGLGVYRFDVPPPQPLSRLDALTVRLAVSASVTRGEVLRYMLELTNSTGHAVALDPCPGYEQRAFNDGLTAAEEHTLNCDAVAALTAGQTVRFEMRFAIPEATRTGTATVYWTFLRPDGARASTAVTAEVEVLGASRN